MTISPDVPMPENMSEAYRDTIEGHPILLYDGFCAVCNRTVQFLLRRDRHARLLFTPLQSLLGQSLLDRYHAQPASGPAEEGVVLITNVLTPSARLTRRSDAMTETLRLLDAPWPAVGALLRLVPRLLREFGYTLFARYRYRLFGRHTACPIPTREQRSRILDVPS